MRCDQLHSGSARSRNIVAVVGIVSGFFTALGGFSRLTAATDELKPRNTTRAFVMSRLVIVAAPAFLLFLGVLLASVTNWFLLGLLELAERMGAAWVGMASH
jgi:hypothetical protein